MTQLNRLRFVAPLACAAALGAVPGVAHAGTTQLLVALRDVGADAIFSGGVAERVPESTHALGFADLALRVVADPTPGDDASGDEVVSAIRQRSTLRDDGVSLEGAFDFDIGPTTPPQPPPGENAAHVASQLAAVWEVSGGNVLMSMDMAATAVGEPSRFRFELQDASTDTTLLDVEGDQELLQRMLGPGRYRILWDFGDISNELGLDQDGAHSLNVTFTDAGPGNPIPLPPAVWAGLLTMGGAAAMRKAQRRGSSGRAKTAPVCLSE
jgi:hypothetical protein